MLAMQFSKSPTLTRHMQMSQGHKHEPGIAVTRTTGTHPHVAEGAGTPSRLNSVSDRRARIRQRSLHHP